jgi:hypothetical protein
MMTFDKPANNLSLTCGLKSRLVTASLAGRDPRYNCRPVDKEILQPVVDLVEAPA